MVTSISLKPAARTRDASPQIDFGIEAAWGEGVHWLSAKRLKGRFPIQLDSCLVAGKLFAVISLANEANRWQSSKGDDTSATGEDLLTG